MGKRREKTTIDWIIDILQTADLRLRIEHPTKVSAKREALKELIIARDQLQSYISELRGEA